MARRQEKLFEESEAVRPQKKKKICRGSVLYSVNWMVISHHKLKTNHEFKLGVQPRFWQGHVLQFNGRIFFGNQKGA